VALTLANATRADRAAVALANCLTIAAPIGVGLAALSRRRDRFAALLIATGALWSLTVLAESRDATLYSTGRVAIWIVEPVIVYLLLAFPSGRLMTSLDRAAMGAVALVAGLLYVATAVLVTHYPEPSPWSTCAADCPRNVFALVTSTPALVDDLVRPLRETLTVLLFLGVAAILARRTARGGPLMRRMPVPGVAMATIRGAALGAYDAARGPEPLSAGVEALGWIYRFSLVLVAVSFALGMMWRGLYAATALQRLTVGLGPQTNPPALRTALADALEDPSLQIVYRLGADADEWIDETGAAVDPPVEGRGRALTDVQLDGQRVAAILSDASLAQDAALMRAATAYALIVLEHGQLLRQLSASVQELSASRARILAVTDRARRTIERDVHDGAQQRLVALRIKLSLESARQAEVSPETAAKLEQLGAEIDETIDEVRSIAQGIYPSLLSDRGLVDALRAAVRNAPRPCTLDADAHAIGRQPPEIESAVYFACVAALGNVDPAASRMAISLRAADRLHFEVRDDRPATAQPGQPEAAWLTDARDRLDAVDGELRIEAAAGGGTQVAGSVPLR
jgi:signal transduction histidine kinase